MLIIMIFILYVIFLYNRSLFYLRHKMLKQKIDNKQKNSDNFRSNWRDNLHDNAASKFEASSKIVFVENESTQKPVSEWNLELVRSWLTTTSHKIASESSGGDEMEGKLVEFSLKLVEYLQNELNSVSFISNSMSVV